jgi:hypothetical protein
MTSDEASVGSLTQKPLTTQQLLLLLLLLLLFLYCSTVKMGKQYK